jgi:hypothetical protein
LLVISLRIFADRKLTVVYIVRQVVAVIATVDQILV